MSSPWTPVVTGSQSAAVGVLLRGLPAVVFVTIIGVETRSYLLVGWTSLQDALVLCLVPGVMLLMATLIVRAVEVSSAGIVVRYYLGRKVAIAWQEIKVAELFTVYSPQESRRTARIEPIRGRRVAFTSNLSNFDSLLTQVEMNSPSGVVRHAPRQRGALEL